MSEIKCNCGEKAILRTVRKEGPNTGRQFYCCSSSRCKFFKWAPNHLVNQEKSISNQNQTKTQSTSTPNTSTKVAPAKCKCNIPAKLLQVNKEGPNKGLKFYINYVIIMKDDGFGHVVKEKASVHFSNGLQIRQIKYYGEKRSILHPRVIKGKNHHKKVKN